VKNQNSRNYGAGCSFHNTIFMNEETIKRRIQASFKKVLEQKAANEIADFLELHFRTFQRDQERIHKLVIKESPRHKAIDAPVCHQLQFEQYWITKQMEKLPLIKWLSSLRESDIDDIIKKNTIAWIDSIDELKPHFSVEGKDAFDTWVENQRKAIGKPSIDHSRD